MEVSEFDIKGPLLFTPKVFVDERGYFFESYNKQSYSAYISDDFVQDNESCSGENVLRGLHLQLSPYQQGKLVRVTRGEVFDVVVDIRLDSNTFGEHVSVVLSEENRAQLWVPPGFAHGFVSRVKHTVLQYKCTNVYHKESEQILTWNDPELKIDWGVTQPIVSEKDAQGLSLIELKVKLEENAS